MVSIAKYSDIHKMDDPFCVPGSVCVLLKLVHLLNTERSDKALPQGRVWVGVGRDSDKELGRSYLNSSQLFIGMSFTSIVQNALMNALARRAFVINGMLRSIAARRIL